MNQQVNDLVMNASDEILAGPDSAQRSPEEEQKFRKQRLAAALRIFGKFGFPEMGIVGAGIGTLISRVAMIVLIWYLLKNDPKTKVL